MNQNPIIDTGCSRDVFGIDYAVAMCNAIGIHFDLELLNCDPFYHGYSVKCSEAKLAIRIWNFPLADLHGTVFELPFYLVVGNGYLVVGNVIASKCPILNDESVRIIPEGIGSSSQRTYLAIIAHTFCSTKPARHCSTPGSRDFAQEAGPVPRRKALSLSAARCQTRLAAESAS